MVSKGRNAIKPALEVEEIAHLYHNLKKEFNRVKDENARMKTRLAVLNTQANKRDEKLIGLNQELHALKTEQALLNKSVTVVDRSRFADQSGEGELS